MILPAWAVYLGCAALFLGCALVPEVVAALVAMWCVLMLFRMASDGVHPLDDDLEF